MRYFKQKGLALIIPLIAIAAFAVIGIGAAIITKQSDGEIEEMAEDALEEELEDSLGLPDDSLEGKIDLTPGSPEKLRA